MSLSWYSSINSIRLNNKTTKKLWGPTEIWTRIAGFKVQSANHYTMGPYDNNSFVICMNFSFKIFFLINSMGNKKTTHKMVVVGVQGSGKSMFSRLFEPRVKGIYTIWTLLPVLSWKKEFCWWHFSCILEQTTNYSVFNDIKNDWSIFIEIWFCFFRCDKFG